MASMMNESDKAWRDSFDPKHPDYHGGNTEAAPYSMEKANPVGVSEFQDENATPASESF